MSCANCPGWFVPSSSVWIESPKCSGCASLRELRIITPTPDGVIVGAGPISFTLAVALTAHGRGVTIVDNQPRGQNTSRASVVYSRTSRNARLKWSGWGSALRAPFRGMSRPIAVAPIDSVETTLQSKARAETLERYKSRRSTAPPL